MAAHFLSTSQELNTTPESLYSNASTSDDSFACSSEEEGGLRYKNNLDDSDEFECYQCYSGRTMATCVLRIHLSTSQELDISSESLSSKSSTSDDSFAYSSEEEGGLRYKNNLDDSDICECDQCLSGAYRISSCGKRKVCMFISSLKNEITDMQESKKHLQADLIKKDKEIKDKNAMIDKLENQLKIIQELEEQLNEKDQNITETNTFSIITLIKSTILLDVKLFSNFRRPELEEKLKEKDRDIIEKNKVIAALENQCKLESDKLEQTCKTNNERIQELEEILNEKEKDIKKKSNAIEDLEKQCKMESQKLDEIYKANNERIQKLEEKLCKKDREITAKNQAVATLESQCKK
ncbi:RUN and FYVE domain-containing protein 2-like [Ruditapes philippinarum]|uniref:RUN and FYVE domain-containing protein 2-like n=1 Tax=Ruditapes philippinarum TaxID=129788 RepID=UPI00295AE399|nr:RUN and FYVE domain-containing protein 2-like [Ruditapes philippinarum]